MADLHGYRFNEVGLVKECYTGIRVAQCMGNVQAAMPEYVNWRGRTTENEGISSPSCIFESRQTNEGAYLQTQHILDI